jgi:hypothetical protein
VGGAAQEVAPHEPFQVADLPTQRGLGQVEPGGGPPEVELLGHGHERAQVPHLDRVRGLREREHLAAALRAVVHGSHHRRSTRPLVMQTVHDGHA